MNNTSIHLWLIVNEQKTKYLRCSNNKTGLNRTDIDSKCLKQLKSYKYLGPTVNGINSIEEESKERTSLGNNNYAKKKKIFRSKLVSKKAKLK